MAMSDPRIPPSANGPDGAQPFATLTPVNALAKMAFNDVFEATVLGGQKTQTCRDHPLRMVIQDEQRYDADVARYRWDEERRRETSESLTEPDTDPEASNDGSLGMIWTGCYVFALFPPPSAPDVGWTAGKTHAGEQVPSNDLLLCTEGFTKRHDVHLRTSPARFNFAQDTAAFFVTRRTRSPHDELTVNGIPVERQIHTLNQQKMRIRLNLFEYVFEYTKFAATDQFYTGRRAYISASVGGPSISPFDMPTPRHETRTMGQWTLSNPLGKGSEGRVFLASNSRNEVVAIKVIERLARSTNRINAEIAMYQEVTDLAKDDDDGKRLVVLKEIIYPRGEEKFSSGSAFDQVGLVIEPMAPATLASMVNNISGGQKGMSLESATLFRDALRGLRFLHAHGWVHCDVKPQNIGVLTHPLRAVLLDLGQITKLPLGAKLVAIPGCAGTINYLSPEREMDEYDHGIDVWPMGVIGYELTYGRHPFKFAANPWRHGSDNERLRPPWQEKYEKAIALVSADSEQWLAQQPGAEDQEYLQFGELLAQMMRQRWAKHNSARRVSIDEVLQHHAWDYFSVAGPQTKRGKTGGADARP